jgi:hypothetical protein
MASGVFGLKKVYKRQVENINNGNFASWPEGATYGYFGGGNDGNRICTITRLDFSNETANNPGNNLPSESQLLAAISNSFYGYFGGGNNPVINTIRRLDFSNETLSLPGKNLPLALNDFAATSSNSYGYFGGGTTGTNPNINSVSTISRFDFSNETVSDINNKLPSVRTALSALSSNSYGYFGGGDPDGGGLISQIIRLDFSNDIVSDPGKYFSGRDRLTATSSSSYGYFGGGNDGSRICTITRLDFSNETVSNTTNLPSARDLLTATSSSSYVYFGGGNDGNRICTITRLDFSNETVRNTTNLPSARDSLTALSGGQSILRGKGFKTYGYLTIGDTSQSSVSRLDFSTDSISSLSSLISAHGGYLAATSSNSYGYFAGGFGPPGAVTVSNISYLDFSNETTVNLNNKLQYAVYASQAFSGNSYSHFIGGAEASGTYRTTNNRIDFFNQTVSQDPRSLSSGSYSRARGASFSSNQYGYIAGGIGGTIVNNIIKMDFYSDAIFKTIYPFPYPSYYGAGGISGPSYGYFAGGIFPTLTSPAIEGTTIIGRLDFSSEVVSSPLSSNLPGNKLNTVLFESKFYGYFVGGSTSNVIKLDFSTESMFDITPVSPPVQTGSAAGLSNSN